MEKGIDETEDPAIEFPPLITPAKGFDVELGKKTKHQPNKKLMDTTKNTPYYSHYFSNKPHQNFYAETNHSPILVSLEVFGKGTL